MAHMIHLPQGGGSTVALMGNAPHEEDTGNITIEQLVNLSGSFTITRQTPGKSPLHETVAVSFSPWMLKVWAAIRILPATTWPELVSSCTEGMIVDGLPVSMDDPEKAKKINQSIDVALASLTWLGLVSADRVIRDGLDKGIENGETARILRETAKIREQRARDLQIERARLEFRLKQLSGDDASERKGKKGATGGA